MPNRTGLGFLLFEKLFNLLKEDKKIPEENSDILVMPEEN